MSDLHDARMRELTYRLVRMAPLAPPFPEESVTQLNPTPPPRRRPAPVWAVIAAAVVLVAIGVPALLSLGDDNQVAATTEPPSTEASSTSVAPTTEAPPSSEFLTIIDLDGLNWVRGDIGLGRIVGSDGGSVIGHSMPFVNFKFVAWDGDDGLVLLDETGSLIWVRPEEEVPVPTDVFDGKLVTIDDVVVLNGRPVAAVRSWDFETAWVDIETGEQVPGDPSRVHYSDELGLQLGAQGRLVRVEYPENLDVERDETGALVWPFDLPELVVLSTDGEELARIRMGSEHQPWIRLHDFDGRRVVVSVEPIEPALPATTVYVIDLECADCTEVIDLPGADVFDLVGILKSTGPVLTDFDL